ncbi:DUF488 family protein [Clostridium cadaveris]|uniref:DUF488 domain-containing protein n=1 Tax=Clostridium cadaveris TaxID=1529 RepID=UPI0015B5576D|nr:DUF488 domain-containing protein [Clostridium cadaveris]NWK12375.1 DUF488 domain-containing protein [Clostridium cadaveris]
MKMYTVGCSTNTNEKFLELLKKYDVNCLVDVRSLPFSKYTPQFNKENLKIFLKKNKIAYIWMGKEFGARRDDRSLYNQLGYLDFEKVRKSEEFLLGVNRIRIGLEKGYNIALMCTEKDPIDCHRNILVAKGLEDNGIEVNHILQDGSLMNRYQIEIRLLDMYYKDRNQLNFDMILGNSLSEEEMIEDAYRRRNRDIGYEFNEE